MTTSINWPPGLPQQPTVKGYGEGGGVHVLRAPVDAGPAKLRKVGLRADVMPINFQMSTSQVASFVTFVKTTIAGVKRFNFTHPRTGASVEVRLIPDQEGEFYRVSYIGPLLWDVSMQMEILP